MLPANDKSWNPYVAGALTGLLIILTTWFTGQYFGASMSFVRAAAYIERVFSPGHVSSEAYFKLFPPIIDWQFLFVAGILIGSFLSSITSGSFRIQAVPDMWAARFGPGRLKRGIVAVIGGALVLFGARLAGGCPSGMGLGTLVQLGVSGLISLICFFIGGIIVAKILYHGDKSK